MISINDVRNTVLFILEKNNNGFVTPMQFNHYCQLAQMKIFEDLFTKYNQFVNKQNRRLTGTEYADIPKNIREQIDVYATYSTPSNFTYDSGNDLWSYTDTNLYRAEGLSLITDATEKRVDIEEVQKRELNVLKNSPLTTPSMLFPVYTRIGESFRIDPIVPTGYSAELFFLRKPVMPNWSYVLVNSNPIYNASASDLADVDLHISLYNDVVMAVLGYSGLSIREEQITQAVNSEEMAEWQKQQQP